MCEKPGNNSDDSWEAECMIKIQMRGDLLVRLTGIRHQWASKGAASSTGIYHSGGNICRHCHACVTQTTPVWCMQLCFTFHSHSYLPFPCLGLKLNFKSRYFFPALFLFSLSRSFFFLSETIPHRMNPQGLYPFLLNKDPTTRPYTPALPSSPPTHTPPPPSFGCVNIPWAAAPTPWIDKQFWLENFIWSSRVWMTDVNSEQWLYGTCDI